MQQYCLGLILSHRGPNSAKNAIIEEAARSSGLPVELWAMREVAKTWHEIVTLQRASNQPHIGEYQENRDTSFFPRDNQERQDASTILQHKSGRDFAAQDDLSEVDTSPEPSDLRSDQPQEERTNPSIKSPEEPEAETTNLRTQDDAIETMALLR